MPGGKCSLLSGKTAGKNCGAGRDLHSRFDGADQSTCECESIE